MSLQSNTANYRPGMHTTALFRANAGFLKQGKDFSVFSRAALILTWPKTGLWQLDKLQTTLSASFSRAGAVYTAATFPATISSRCESLVQTGLKRESDNK